MQILCGSYGTGGYRQVRTPPNELSRPNSMGVRSDRQGAVVSTWLLHLDRSRPSRQRRARIAMSRTYHRSLYPLLGLALLLGSRPAEAGAAAFKTPVPMTAACNFFGQAGKGAVGTEVASAEVERLIKRIVDASGLKKNFEVRAAPVPNAAAVVVEGQRYILYNPGFATELGRMNGRIWTLLSVLAHEVGHHLNGHTLAANGSRPPIELEADYFSGFILQKLGSPRSDAMLVMSRLAPEAGGSTHPGRNDRVSAIADGWNAACMTDVDCWGSTDDNRVDPDDESGPALRDGMARPSSSDRPTLPQPALQHFQ